MFEWAYSGVNSSVPGNGGPECAAYVSSTRKLIETVITLCLSCVLVTWGYRRLSEPEIKAYVRRDRGGKRLLLILMSLIWGMEIGFKLASQTVIYLLNPCHVTTAIQLPFETSIYWIQHSMMMVVPYYLLRLGGVYNVEKLSDFSWCVMSFGLNLAYHFGFLQLFAIPSQVNLNNMLCPAPSDPFAGSYYRVFAVLHQAALCPLTCKLYCWISAFFLTKFGPTRVKRDLSSDVTLSCMQNAELPSPQVHYPEANNISTKDAHVHNE
ncbi:Transmembrane protein 164 [Gryllus bimaculatus]|nr:Transmembrane protein 164 [Gryllus bimaculatus]